MVKKLITGGLATLVLSTAMLCLYQLKYQLPTSPSYNTRSRDLFDRALPFTTWKHGQVTVTKPATDTNCTALVEGDQQATQLARFSLKGWRDAETEEEFARKINNCSYIREEFGNLFYVSEEELKFPLAFSLVVHDRPKQVYRLLKAIYRPHNIYCIHTDGKQNAGYISIFLSISQCLDNVLVSSHLSRVYWGHHSLMDAQLNCAEDLVQYPLTRWKYVINICGFELPLRTNREIVQVLKTLNGSSVVNSHPISVKQYRDRFTYKFVLGRTDNNSRKSKLPSVPHNITIYKSLTQVALTRDFVTFLFTNEKAVDFRRYLKNVWIPEEQYYASLYHLPEAPGGQASIPSGTVMPIVDQVIWMHSKNPPEKYCSGSIVRGICILSSADLHRVYELGFSKRFSMFFNKFYLKQDHIVMDCMEKRLVLQNRKEFASDHYKTLR